MMDAVGILTLVVLMFAVPVLVKTASNIVGVVLGIGFAILMVFLIPYLWKELK